MNKDELLPLLDRGGTEAAPAATALAVTAVAPAEPAAGASPTALSVDEWGLRRGRDLLGESERLRRATEDEFAAADFFTAAFVPDPQLLPTCADPQRREFLGQMLDTPDYHALHAATMLDDTASAIAATAFAEQFADLKKGADAPTDALDREMATLRAVGRALADAGKEVGECKEAAAALGLGPGSPGSNDAKAIAALFRRVRSDPNLRRICDLAGRYRRVAQSQQRRKALHGMDDVVGVELGGDLGRALPHELAKLAIPEFEDDTLRRLVERQLMSREYHATEPVAKGPIIVVTDESGSMEGEKVHTAKALALALAWVARQQRRWCALVAYSGGTGERLLPLPPGRWDEARLMDWLCAFLGGGSSLDVPVEEMPRYYRDLKAPIGATDVLFVTDCQCRIPEPLRIRILQWKDSVKARFITLVIGGAAGDLAGISDEVHLVASLSATEEAVGRVLSI